MYIITDESNEIMNISSILNDCGDRYQVEENLYILKSDNQNIYSIETVGQEVTPCKYCYTELDGFYINPSWVEPIDTEKEIQSLKAQNDELQFTSLDLNIRVSMLEMV